MMPAALAFICFWVGAALLLGWILNPWVAAALIVGGILYLIWLVWGTYKDLDKVMRHRSRDIE